MVVDEEAVEEGLPLVVHLGEERHHDEPGAGDREEHQDAGEQPHAEHLGEEDGHRLLPLADRLPVLGAGQPPPVEGPARSVPGKDARHRVGQDDDRRETHPEQALGQGGEPAEDVERHPPPGAMGGRFVEQADDRAGHRGDEAGHEGRVRDHLPGDQEEQRHGAEHHRAGQPHPSVHGPAQGHSEQRQRGHDQEDEGQPHAPLGVEGQLSGGPVRPHQGHAQHVHPHGERRLGEEPAALPVRMDVVVAGDHLPGDLAVVGFPGVPEPDGADVGNEHHCSDQQRHRDQPTLGVDREQAADPRMPEDAVTEEHLRDPRLERLTFPHVHVAAPCSMGPWLGRGLVDP